MSILHITTGSNYNVTKSYIRFINENFSIKKHKIIVIDSIENIPKEFFRIPNIIIINKDKREHRKKFLIIY